MGTMTPAGRSTGLPLGTHVRVLPDRPDDRGRLTEVFRRSWDSGVDPIQWNLVDNEAGVLRGVHVHVRHADYLLVVTGRAVIGLQDLRRHSPTAGLAAIVELDGEARAALVIPPGVAHGFAFPTAGVHLYGVDAYWDPDDELGCRWDDPDLHIDWPDRDVRVSERDATAGTLAELLELLDPHQARLYPPPA